MVDQNQHLIVLENLSKSYQEGRSVRHVLIDANAEFARGEFVAILGKSGSGKSTLLNLISGIDRSDSGRIYMNGDDLTEMKDDDRTMIRRNQMGFLFQFFNLIPTLTVLENVTLPLELIGLSLHESEEKARMILNEVGLINRIGTFPENLSGGEQQRVALARALVHNPQVVLADEPTGNLDEDTGQLVLELLDRMTRQSGKNLIMVTHNMDAATMADRVLSLQDGKLIGAPVTVTK